MATTDVYDGRDLFAAVCDLAEAVKVAAHLNAEGWNAAIRSPKFAALCEGAGTSPSFFLAEEVPA